MAAIAAVVLGWVHAEQTRAEQVRRQWGTTRTVVRARVDLGGGSALTPEVIEIVDLPVAVVPRSAVAAIDHDARLAGRLSAGEIVTSVHLAVASSRGPVASQLRPDEAAIAVRADAVIPALELGDPILAIAASEPIAGAEPFIAPGRVVGVDDERVTIAFDLDAAPAVGMAVQSGRLTIAASGSTDPLTAGSKG